jgi:hypothetical protein
MVTTFGATVARTHQAITMTLAQLGIRERTDNNQGRGRGRQNGRGHQNNSDRGNNGARTDNYHSNSTNTSGNAISGYQNNNANDAYLLDTPLFRFASSTAPQNPSHIPPIKDDEDGRTQRNPCETFSNGSWSPGYISSLIQRSQLWLEPIISLEHSKSLSSSSCSIVLYYIIPWMHALSFEKSASNIRLSFRDTSEEEDHALSLGNLFKRRKSNQILVKLPEYYRSAPPPALEPEGGAAPKYFMLDMISPAITTVNPTVPNVTYRNAFGCPSPS